MFIIFSKDDNDYVRLVGTFTNRQELNNFVKFSANNQLLYCIEKIKINHVLNLAVGREWQDLYKWVKNIDEYTWE